jgi:hypothetical protein
MVSSSAFALADTSAASIQTPSVALMSARVTLVLNNASHRKQFTSLNRPSNMLREAVATHSFHPGKKGFKLLVVDLSDKIE